jgi:hypothetical protein
MWNIIETVKRAAGPKARARENTQMKRIMKDFDKRYCGLGTINTRKKMEIKEFVGEFEFRLAAQWEYED